MQGLLRKPSVPSGPLLVFDTQPLAKPPAGVLFHRSVGLAGRSQTEVVGPAIDLPVERCYQRFRTLLGLTPAGSRVASDPLCLHAVATTPAGSMELIRSYRSHDVGLPQITDGLAPP